MGYSGLLGWHLLLHVDVVHQLLHLGVLILLVGHRYGGSRLLLVEAIDIWALSGAVIASLRDQLAVCTGASSGCSHCQTARVDEKLVTNALTASGMRSTTVVVVQVLPCAEAR